MMRTVDVISLGCSKNLVDSEKLLRQFEAAGFTIRHNPHEVSGEIVVVNTCGFIADAQEESINTILSLGQLKREGRIDSTGHGCSPTWARVIVPTWPVSAC